MAEQLPAASNSPQESSSRLLGWRRRVDLQAFPLSPVNDGAKGLKDPVSLRYYEFSEQEWFLWEQLSRPLTWQQWCDGFEQRFPTESLTLPRAKQFLAQLIQDQLVVSAGVGATSGLAKRRQARLSALRRAAWFNPLAIRWRGISPEPWLRRWGTLFSCLWTPTAAGFGLLLLFSAVLLILGDWDWFAQAVPQSMAWWTPSHLVVLLGSLALLKALHELGHLLACHHVGAECHEVGVLWLVFTPTLYCNVTDIWRIPSRTSRCLVNGAGMWIEAQLAALACWLFWFSEPGWFHAVCANVAIVGGVSTLLFNLNPLLRYDGYFLLSDALQIPNLGEVANHSFRSQAVALLTGEWPVQSRSWAPRLTRFLALFAMASFVYRLLLLFAIFWLVNELLDPYGMAEIVPILALLVGGTWLWSLVVGERQAWRSLWPSHRTARLRGTITGLALLGLLVALASIPWPRRMEAPAVCEPVSVTLTATVEGRVVEARPLGSSVRSGEIVLRLENPMLAAELEQLTEDLHLQDLRLTHLLHRRLSDPTVAARLPAAEALRQSLYDQLTQRKADAEALVIRAPQAGQILSVPAAPVSAPTQLSGYQGSLQDPRNLLAWVPVGAELCRIGDPQKLTATAYVSEDEVAAMRIGQPVTIVCREIPTQRFRGTVQDLAPVPPETLSPERLHRLGLPVTAAATASPQLAGAWTQVRIPLEPLSLSLPTESTGVAWIEVAPESFFTRMKRWFLQTFRLSREFGPVAPLTSVP